MFLQDPHEMLGYGDANTETRYGNVMFSAYMNGICSSSNRDFIKIGNKHQYKPNLFKTKLKAIINLIAFFLSIISIIIIA
jgi:hypothetical protein